MRCSEARKMLSECLDGPLMPTAAQALNTHLSACDVCKRYARALERLDEALAVPIEREVPAGFTAAVMHRLVTAQTVAEPDRVISARRAVVTRLVCATALLSLFLVLAAMGNALAYYLLPADFAPLAFATQIIAATADLLDAAVTLIDVTGALLPLFIPREATPFIAATAPLAALAMAVWALMFWPISNRRRVA